MRKGDRIVVQGRLRLRAWENGEKSGTAVEIEAESIGHDLAWGITTLTKVRREPAGDGDTASRATPGTSTWLNVGAPSEESAVIDEARAAGFADDIEPHGSGDPEGVSVDDGSRLAAAV